MRTTEAFAAMAREQFKNLAGKLPADVASITEQSERGVYCLRLDPKSATSSSLVILIEDTGDGRGCTVFIGAHGRFERLPEDADLIADFVRAAIFGKVRETVWEWRAKPLRVLTKVQIGEVLLSHDWGLLVGMPAILILGPWIRKREIQYQPYSA